MTLVKKVKYLILFLLSIHVGVIFAQNGIYINEFQASNQTTITDGDFKAFSDWVELYNSHGYDVNIGGYYLTDNGQNIMKWQFPVNTILPANGFLLVWCDGRDVFLEDYHSNFKLSSEGEEIGFYDQEQNLIDFVDFNNQVIDVSYGRKPDGTVNWYYFALPTPGEYNTTEGYLDNGQSPDVDFSLSPGFYDSPQALLLSNPGTISEIRYTIDGSSPHEGSLLYSSPVSIDSTLVIRARTYQSGILPGKIFSQSYFISESTSLPVFSMIINPEFLWDPEIGIYVDENIEIRTEWERRALFEYFNTNHEHDFTTNADIRLFGNSAFYYPQKTLSVFADPPLEYQLFQSKETEKFYSFLLRSSSDDWPYTMMRDALLQSIYEDQLQLDYQAYTPSVLFINGEYFGIHNIREKINERFIETHHDVDPDNLDLIFMDLRDTTITALAGDLAELDEILSFIQNNDLSIDENFDVVKDKIYLDNYIDYLIGNIFFSNTSWHHNVKIWKSKDEGSKWQWFLYDLDRGMTPYYLNLYSVIEDIDTTGLFFPHLRQNTEFKEQFLNRFCGFINLTFSEARVNHFIDSLQNKIADEIAAHSLRWKNECDLYGNCGIQSYEDWLDNVGILKEYSNEAPEKVIQYVMDFFGLQDKIILSIDIINPDKGEIYINGVEYKQGNINWTYFRGIPLQIVAVPEPDMLFLGWKNISFNDTLMIAPESDTVLTAQFGNYCYLPEVISQDLILGDNCNAYFTQGNTTIEQNVTLAIENGIHIFVSSGDSILVNGSLMLNGTENSPVILRSVGVSEHWGCIKATNAMVHLNHAEFFNCKSAIAMNGGDLVFNHCKVRYSPFFFADIISVHDANSVITGNEFFGPDYPGKTDVIDCDEIKSGLIENNYISGTTDDGIDVGTGSANVTIRGNTILHCASMGISVGESSHAILERNVIANCEVGIQVHSQAIAQIDHNTLHANGVSIRCFHYDNEPLSGGHAIVSNSILSNTETSVYELFENSTISFSYSLADTDTISGEGNLIDNPMFVDPEGFDFRLKAGSPCINSGDPAYPHDPDGTRTDMGAIYYNYSSSYPEYTIGKNILVFPNPSLGQFTIFLKDTTEYIKVVEIFNPQGICVFKTESVNKEIINLNNVFKGQGIFYVRVKSSGGNRYTEKLLILSPKEK